MKKQLLVIGCVLSIFNVQAMSSEGHGKVKLPSEEILKKRLVAFEYIFEKKDFIQQLANRTVFPMAVVDFLNSIAFDYRCNNSIKKDIKDTEQAILRIIFQDCPMAIEELKRKKVLK